MRKVGAILRALDHIAVPGLVKTVPDSLLPLDTTRRSDTAPDGRRGRARSPGLQPTDWRLGLALLLAGLAAALVLGELGLRALDQSYYWAFAKRPDPVLGWRPPPHRAAWQRFEGAALVRTNALGFRDRDHAVAKPPGVLRIAVLGDSFTEAVQVPLAQTWWQVMERRLNGDGCHLPRRVETLDFAVSGYSTAQALLSWRAHARRFAPDLVVLAFFIGNDLTENERALDDEPLRPYLRATASSGGPQPAPPQAGAPADIAVRGLALDDGFRQGSAYRVATSPRGRARQWLLEHSRIAQLLVQARDARRMRAQPSRRAERGAAELHEPGVDNAIYREPDSAAWQRAWNATEAMLAAFAGEVRATGAQPVLMLIGTGAQVHPNALARARFAAAIGVSDLGYPVRRLLATAEQQRLPVINLPALMALRAEGEGEPLHGFAGGRPGFGHWNPLGHAVAGEAAAALVCAALQPTDADRTGRTESPAASD